MKYRFWLQKDVETSILKDFLIRDCHIVGAFIYYFCLMTISSSQNLKNIKSSFGFKKVLKFQSDKIFRSATLKLWVFSFATFTSWPPYPARILKTQNTVFGYKKRSKIESQKIFWSATPTLWVVSFATFVSWPFYQTRIWKTQNTVFGYKKGSKN